MLFTRRSFFQVFASKRHLNMAGAAGTYTATIVMNIDMVIQQYFQQRLARSYIFDDHCSGPFAFEFNRYGKHSPAIYLCSGPEAMLSERTLYIFCSSGWMA